MKMEQKWVSSERGRTCYWLSRAPDPLAKTLVFTHGLTADHRMFAPQADFFSNKCNVLTWDVPLHGLSRPYRDFSYRHAAEELSAILEQENLPSAVLVGMSMGGYPSQAFAEQYPEKTAGFVALDTTPFGSGYYSRSDLWWLRQVEPMIGWFPSGFLKRWIVASASCSDAGRALYREILKGSGKADIRAQTAAAFTVLTEENHDIRLDCPVLILVGERDRTGKCKRYCEAWSARTGRPLVVIPGAAHMSNLDNPEAVNRAISDFLQTL